MFDVTKLDTAARSEEGVEMTLRNPTTGAPIRDSEGAPVTIKFRGRNSDVFRAKQRVITARRTAMQAKGLIQSEVEMKAERTEILEACTMGWSITHNNGQEFPFSPENCAKLWTDPRWEWAAGQSYNFMLEEGNFLAS